MSENSIKLYTCMPNDWPIEKKRQAIKNIIMDLIPAFRDTPPTPDMEPDPLGVDVRITITLEEQEQPAHEHLKEVK